MAQQDDAVRPIVPARLTGGRIATMCVGLFGVQIVWGLHNANTSRIFQTFGAELDQLPLLWIAAPVTGLLIQPIVGHLSDRTMGPLGRRRPYMLAGAVLSALALLGMTAVDSLWQASAILWLLLGAINIAMEPFRAYMADNVPADQRSTGFAMQVVFIGAGAVFASALPWLLTLIAGSATPSPSGALSPSLRLAFRLGAGCLLATVGWTVLRGWDSPFVAERSVPPRARAGGRVGASTRWFVAAVLAAGATALPTAPVALRLLTGAMALFAIVRVIKHRLPGGGPIAGVAIAIADDILAMPAVMRRLALVQFFTWFGLFGLWIYATPALAAQSGGAVDPTSAAYGAAADRVGLLFAGYNGVAAAAAFLLPRIERRVGRRASYAGALLLGAMGLVSLATLTGPAYACLSVVGLGCAWATILSTPYAIVAASVPSRKTGVYMGIHNIFLVIPQLVGAATMGWVVRTLLNGSATFALVLSATALAIGSATALTITDRNDLQNAQGRS